MEYHCFSVDCTDEMYHGSKSLIRERLPSCQPPIISQTYRNAIIIEASSILRKLSNMSADNFYEFAVVFYIYVIRLAEGFDRLAAHTAGFEWVECLHDVSVPDLSVRRVCFERLYVCSKVAIQSFYL